MNDLNGRHAVVTGGGTGIGAAIAVALAARGAGVTICGRRAAPLADTAARHAGIDTVVADVTDEAAVTRLFETVGERAGRLDIVVANAGGTQSRPFSRMDRAAWSETLAANLDSVFLTLRGALEVMDRKRPGRLVAIASTAGLKGYAYVTAYCAAKHGVIGLTRALALELAGTPITVNAVCPGFTDTPLLERSIDNIVDKTGMDAERARGQLTRTNPQGRFIQPGEVADAVTWLCGEHAGAITGQAVSVSGGETT